MPNKKETIEQIVDLLRSLVDEEEPQEKPTARKKATKKKTTKKKTTTRRTTKSKSDSKESSNKFLSMPEMRMFRDDSEIDKKLQVMAPVPRTRTFDPVIVRCRVCGKQETVNPTLVTEINRYKCNACAKSGG